MINVPYGASVSANELATMIVNPTSAIDVNATVFAFFSEVPLSLQKRFISAMNVDSEAAIQVAKKVAVLSGYALPLAT